MRWIVLLMFGGLGLAALIGGVMWGLKRQSLAQQGVETWGRVVAQEESSVSTGSSSRTGSYRNVKKSYSPVVEFVTEGSKTVRFTGSTGGVGDPIIETGTEVKVLYDPAEPGSAQIKSFSQFWLGPLAVTVAGIISLFLGVGGFFVMGGIDRNMAEGEAMMNRQRLIFMPEARVIQGKIIRIEERPENSGRYVFIVQALRPDSSLYEEFSSDHLTFDPGHRFIGREVAVRLDPADRENYYVNADPLLPEILKSRGK